MSLWKHRGWRHPSNLLQTLFTNFCYPFLKFSMERNCLPKQFKSLVMPTVQIKFLQFEMASLFLVQSQSKGAQVITVPRLHPSSQARACLSLCFSGLVISNSLLSATTLYPSSFSHLFKFLKKILITVDIKYYFQVYSVMIRHLYKYKVITPVSQVLI